MIKFLKPMLLSGVTTLVLSSTASAAQHFICYEGDLSQSMPTAVWGCHDDAGGSCRIRQPNAWFEDIGSTLPGNPPGSYQVYRFASAATYSAMVEFFDSNGAASGTRSCSVSVRGSTASFGGTGAASSGARLTGFTTDASGMVTTGVWKRVNPLATGYARIDVRVPGEFVAVGGGAIGAESPSGALIVESCQSDTCFLGVGDWRSWSARTSDTAVAHPALANPHQTTVYAIGMKVNGLSAAQLRSLLIVTNQDFYPAVASLATNQATLLPTAEGHAAPLSGGVRASATNSAGTLLGQYLTESAPVIEYFGRRCNFVSCAPRVTAWKVASKDHIVARPGTLGTWLLALPPKINVGTQTFQVVSKVVWATSGVAAHPSVDVGGLRGEFALTGIGASVDWQRYVQPGQAVAGNLLWKLEPRPDLGGATVASKDHGDVSPATVTAHALGIKLVPVGP